LLLLCGGGGDDGRSAVEGRVLVLHRDTVVVVSVRFVAVVVEFVSFRFGSVRFDFRHHKRLWDDEHNTESKQTAIADPTLASTDLVTKNPK